MKTYLVCEWNKENEKKWSGTPYYLFSEFKNNSQTYNINIKINPLKKILITIYKVFLFFLGKKSFRYLEICALENELDRKLKLDKKSCAILFEEYLTSNTENCYLYIDLSVQYLYKMYQKNDSLLEYTPLNKNVSKHQLIKRYEKSIEFDKRCRGIFTMSKWLTDYLIENTNIDKNKIHYVGAGSNVKINNIDNSHKNGNKFLFIGVDWKRKNGSLVLKSFLALSQNYNNLELYIAGPYKKPYKKDYNNVHFVGNISNSKIEELLNKCDYFVMPSKFEAYGLVFAEALIYGLPCIGKKCYEMPQFITNNKNGLLINNDNERELEKAMEYMYLNKEKFVKYVQNERSKYIAEYSWESVVNRMTKIIQHDLKEA